MNDNQRLVGQRMRLKLTTGDPETRRIDMAALARMRARVANRQPAEPALAATQVDVADMPPLPASLAIEPDPALATVPVVEPSAAPKSRRQGPKPGASKETATPFGAALWRLRLGRGFTQTALAERAELDHSTIARLESGARNPSRPTVELLADALGCDAAGRDALLIAAGFVPDGASEGSGDRLVADLAGLLRWRGLSAGERRAVCATIEIVLRQRRQTPNGVPTTGGE